MSTNQARLRDNIASGTIVPVRRPKAIASVAAPAIETSAKPASRAAGWPIATIAVALAGQALALPLLGATTNTDPWLVAAAFGAAAALAAASVGHFLAGADGADRAKAGAADDLALHDSLSLAVLLGALPYVGTVGMMLLPPGTVILSRVLLHVAQRRRIGGHDAIYAVIPLLAGAVSCELAGWHGFAASAAVLAVAAAVRAWQRGLTDERRDAPWRKWAITAFLCAAGAAIGMDEGVALPAEGSIVLAVLAGLSYGAAAQFGTIRLPRQMARLASAAAPFLAVAIVMALGTAISLPQAAAALLLALAVVGSAPLATGKAGTEAGERRAAVALWPYWG